MTKTILHKTETDEQFKAYLLKILIEDERFAHQLQDILHTQKVQKKAKKNSVVSAKQNIAYSEMPYWKLRSNVKPRDAKPFAIKKETVIELQEQWKDAPSAEELIAQLTK